MISFIFISLTAMMIIFTSSKIPHAMMLSLLASTIISSALLGVVKSFPWFAYILFLIFFGANLILFSYISSLTSNIFLSSTNMKLLSLFTVTISLILLWVFNLPSMDSSMVELTPMSSNFMVKELLSPLTFIVYLYLFLYLLITLIYVVTMMKTYYSPLRNLK